MTLQHGRYVDKELEHARYDMVDEYGGRGEPNLASSGHLRRCSMVDTQIKSLRSFYTIVTNVNGSLEAMDCYINNTRYDMVLESPTTLQCGRYADKELEQ
eukprot:scaffold14737_cov197-Skeletonema_marinoi.AAC.5